MTGLKKFQKTEFSCDYPALTALTQKNRITGFINFCSSYKLVLRCQFMFGRTNLQTSERKKERERETKTERQGERERERERKKEWETQGDRESEKERKRDTERQGKWERKKKINHVKTADLLSFLSIEEPFQTTSKK